MEPMLTFRFVDDDLNLRLLGLLKKAKVRHHVDREGVVHYSRSDEEVVGNELICSIRDAAIPKWQLLSCPADYADRYRKYMIRQRIEFREESINQQLCFLLPRKHRPHSWRLKESNRSNPLKSSQIARKSNEKVAS